MNLTKETWTKTDYQKFIKYLFSIKEDKEHTWEVAVEFYPLSKYQRKKWWKFW